MKSTKIRPDFSVELPDELRGRLEPGDSLDVMVRGGGVTYIKVRKSRAPALSDIIERVRRNPPTNPPSEAEIEDIIHEVRRERQ
jgi:hypothetical protein